MPTRRRLLRTAGAASAAALGATTAGCLFDDGGASSPGPLANVVDTSETLSSSFVTTYACDPDALTDALGGDEALPELARRLLGNVQSNVLGTTIDDLDRLTGQYGQVGGHTGTDVQVVPATGSHVLVTGDVSVDGATAWLGGLDTTSELGQDRGFHRYGTSGEFTEAFVVDDRHLGFGNRRGVSAAPEQIATAAIDAIRADAPVRDQFPELASLADAAEGETLTVGTSFDLVAERPDTGVAAFDPVVASLLAAGVSATIDESDATVQRLFRYRRDRVPDVETVEAALARVGEVDGTGGRSANETDGGSTNESNGGSSNGTESSATAGDVATPLADADWGVRRSGQTVVAEATVPTSDVAAAPEVLRTAFPTPALADVTTAIDPRLLGRTAPPRVRWTASLAGDGGRVAFEHGGGEAVEDVVVRYVADGERVEDRWSGPVEEGDAFETSRPPDSGSLVDLVWAPGTTDETILLRVQTPEA